MKEYMATTIKTRTPGWRGGIHVLLFFRAKFAIFLFYMMRAFKIMLVKFPNLVHFLCAGPYQRWTMVAILEKTKMYRIISDTIFSRFLGSVNLIKIFFRVPLTYEIGLKSLK